MADSILIVGGGVVGLTAALECANAGARAIVLEQDAIVGGKLAAAMTKQSSVGQDIDGVSIPQFDALSAAERIEVMTLADLTSVDGRPGLFEVAIRERARFVTDACTLCNHCRPACPVVQPNEHDAGLSYRKAIYLPIQDGLPPEFVIDIDSCLNTPPNYLPCNRCMEVCDDDAIHFDVPLEQQHGRQVGAIVITTGFDVVTGDLAARCGYGGHPDIVTDAEMERLLMAPGPTGGFAAKPSNEDYPNSVLFILDELSPLSVHTASSQIRRLIAQDIGRIAVLVTYQPGDGERSRLQQSLPDGLTVNFGMLQKTEPHADNTIAVTFADFSSSRIPEAQYDMVVLSASVVPASGLEGLAQVVGCELGDDGYVVRVDSDHGCATTRDGVYVAGGAGGPAILGEAVEEARAAAAAALTHLDERLLRGDAAAVAGQDTAPAAAGLSEDEMRLRFERALLAMLEGGQ